jgi:phage-related tail protein
MAKSNQSRGARQSSGSSSGSGNRSHGRGNSGNRGSGSGGGGSQRTRSRKGNPDSPMSRGYSAGRDRGRAAVDSIKSAGSRAVESVGEHPIPAALIGAGLAWLLLESRGIRPTEVPIVERGKEAIGTVGHTIADAAGTAASSVKEGASTLGEYASNAASAIGETATSGIDAGKEAIGNLWERHPLAMSAAILSAGIAAGMLLPATRRENNMLGTTASNLAERAREKTTEFIERATSTARAFTGGGNSSSSGSSRRRSGGGRGSSRRTART